MGYTEVHALQTAEHEAVNPNGIPTKTELYPVKFFTQIYKDQSQKNKIRQKRCTAVNFHSPLRYTLMCKTIHNIFISLILYFIILDFRLHIFYISYVSLFTLSFYKTAALFPKLPFYMQIKIILLCNGILFTVTWQI